MRDAKYKIKMKKIWGRRAKSFKDAEEFDKKYYQAMSRKERIETVEFLREVYYKIKGHKNESRKGLRRIVRVIQ